tara:strand:- start:1042 stop:2337 length:1296 start_codon:yes stop_codon:yes gene_type:complete
MFRRPGSARKAAGILASSQELMNQVEPVRMNIGGSVNNAVAERDILAEYEKLLLEQTGRKTPGNFLTDLGINMATSALTNPQLGKTDAAIAGLTGAFAQATKRKEKEDARELAALKGQVDIETIRRTRAKAIQDRFTSDQRNALSAAGAVLNADGSITKGKTTFADLSDFMSRVDKKTLDTFQSSFNKLGSDAEARSIKLLRNPDVNPLDKVLTILSKAPKDDAFGTRAQTIADMATNADFVPKKNDKGQITGFQINFDGDQYIFTPTLQLLDIDRNVLGNNTDGDGDGKDGGTGDGGDGKDGGTGDGGDGGDGKDGGTGGGTEITAITDETILSLMEQDPIVRREVNSLQAMTNKRQETLQAGGDIDYIDSIIERQNLRVQESAQKALTRLSTPNPQNRRALLRRNPPPSKLQEMAEEMIAAGDNDPAGS